MADNNIMTRDFLKVLQDAARNPNEYYNTHYHQLTLENGNDEIETLIALLISYGSRFTIGEFLKIRDCILAHPQYSNDLEYQYYTHIASAGIYRDKSHYESSRSFYLIAHELSLLLNDKDKTILSLSSLATVYNEEEEPEKALPYIEDAIDLLGYVSDPNRLAQTYFVYSSILKKLNRINQAIDSAEKAVYYYEQTEQYETRYYFMTSLILQASLLYMSHNHEKANSIMAKAVEIGEKNDHMISLQCELEVIAHYFSITGEYKKAYSFLKAFTQFVQEQKTKRLIPDRQWTSEKVEKIDSLRYLLLKN